MTTTTATKSATGNTLDEELNAFPSKFGNKAKIYIIILPIQYYIGNYSQYNNWIKINEGNTDRHIQHTEKNEVKLFLCTVDLIAHIENLMEF